MLKNVKQKKVLIVILSILLLLSVFTLTGCGPQIGGTPAGGHEAQNIGENQSLGEQTQGTQNNNVQQGITTILTVVYGFDDGRTESLIKYSNDNNYYVIDKAGKVVYTISDDNMDISKNRVKYSNGYLLIDTQKYGPGGEETKINYVKDLRDGSTKLEGNETTELVNVTESGYVLERVTIEALGGTTYESRIVDLSGNVVWRSEDNYDVECFETVVGDIVAYAGSSYSGYSFINAKTGKTMDLGFSCVKGYFDCFVFGDYILTGVSANNDDYLIIDINNFKKIEPELSHVHKILNDTYIYSTPLWGTVGVYDMQGKLAKDLTEGGVEDIFYHNGTYYVISDTGFFYTMDDKFAYVKQPIKMLEDTYEDIEIGQYITTFTVDSTSYYMQTSQFDPSQDMTQTAMQGTLDSSNGNVGFITSNGLTKLYNLETLQEIAIQK